MQSNLKWLRVWDAENGYQQTTVAKTFLECKVESTRRVGTPRLGGVEDVENDIQELKVKTWRTKKKEYNKGHQGSLQQRRK
jgi:hypothetical protein